MATISNNFGAFNALFNFNRGEAGQNAALARLSSGEKISQAVDAPADLATSNDLRSEVRALRELRKANFDAVNTLRLADETLQETYNMIYRAMELAETAASDTPGDPSRLSYDIEYQEILNTLEQLNETVDINDNTVFGAVGSTITANLDTEVTGAGDQVTVSTTPISPASLGLAGTDLMSTANASTALAGLRDALNSLNRQNAIIGVADKRITNNITSLTERIDSTRSQDSMIRDTDIAEETVKLTKYQILTQSNVAAMAQANLSTDGVLQLLS